MKNGNGVQYRKIAKLFREYVLIHIWYKVYKTYMENVLVIKTVKTIFFHFSELYKLDLSELWQNYINLSQKRG